MYQRIHGPRECYEACLVKALQEMGYSVRLSSDQEDELEGFDAIDEEHGLKIDFYAGNGNNGILAAKLAKAALKGIQVFHVPQELILDVWQGRCQVLQELDERYYQFLENVGAFRKSRLVAVA